jgi:hypothetical protein
VPGKRSGLRIVLLGAVAIVLLYALIPGAYDGFIDWLIGFQRGLARTANNLSPF